MTLSRVYFIKEFKITFKRIGQNFQVPENFIIDFKISENSSKLSFKIPRNVSPN